MFTLYFSTYLTRQTKVNLKQEINDSSSQINEFIEHRGHKDKRYFSLISMLSFVFCGIPRNGTYSNIYVQCYHKYIYIESASNGLENISVYVKSKHLILAFDRAWKRHYDWVI